MNLFSLQNHMIKIRCDSKCMGLGSIHRVKDWNLGMRLRFKA